MPLVRRPSVPLSDYRVGVALVGVVNGINSSFDAPEAFIQKPPGLSISVYLNGIRQSEGDDYTVSTTGPIGTGETVSLVEPPRPGDKLTADYVAA